MENKVGQEELSFNHASEMRSGKDVESKLTNLCGQIL